MADRANSTIASEVHPLTGSSAPGADTLDRLHAGQEGARDRVPTDVDVAAQRAAVMRLAKLHGLDTEVIDLAERTEALARREVRLWQRRSDLDDKANNALPPRPVRTERKNRLTYDETSVDGVHTCTFREPAGWRDELRAAEETFQAEVAGYERLQASAEAAVGLPLVDKLACRASRRLARWALRLADLPPRTYAGLQAKHAVVRATVEDGQLYDQWRQALSIAVSADAIRLIEAEAEERFREDQARDGELFSLIARYGPASKVWDDADEDSTPICMAWWEARPPMPATLRGRLTDYPFEASGREKVEGSTSYFTVYIDTDIKRLRARPDPVKVIEHRSPAPWNSDETVVRCERVPDPRLTYRKAEIIGAWDAWQAEIERLRETTGLNAANAVVDAAARRVNEIEDAILDYLPRTFEGLQAKARWIASAPLSDQRAQHLLRDLCRMPPVALAPSAQAVPSMEVVETYRTFLDMEFRFLNWETHGTAGASGGIWLDNPAGRLHGQSEPAPSSRAITVLTALGLMPNSTAEDRRIAEERAA